MPWRETRDPYGIWVSEVMLQQTRVETVRDRWVAFLAAFPTLEALAGADQQAVLKAFEGLGYYARVRKLHEAARLLVAKGAAGLPADAEALRALPGFGDYTTAAVGSIAFGLPLAAVDGNVIRVLTRLLGEDGEVSRAPVRRRLQAAADALLARRSAGDWNQAMMELGATVCTPRRPTCTSCPLRKDCKAFAEGDPTRYPNKRKRGPTPHHRIAAGIVWKGAEVLVARRPAEGLLGGLWEFPGGKVEAGESDEAAIAREVREETGVDVEVREHFLSVDHAYTHFKITLVLHHCRWRAGTPEALGCEAPAFQPFEALEALPFPRANQRALEALRASGPPAWVTA